MDYVSKRKIWFSISAIIIILGFIFLILQGLNYGIDFAGGTIIHIDLHRTFEVEDIKKITDSLDSGADITYAGEDRDQVIIQTQISITEGQRSDLFQRFQEQFNITEQDILSVDQVDPIIGDELKNQVLVGIILAIVAMLIYITIRFEISFAIAAIIALAHDMLILISFYAILRIQVNAPFIAAILTVLGYSINDTIVVFDRIRENRKKAKKLKLEDLINSSISQSLMRCINTSVTTLFTITALYIFGVEAVKSFALPLIIGFVAGTYSSIFIASPVWYIIKNRKIHA